MRGWSFAQLGGALVADEPCWDFEADCLRLLRESRIGALDLGTGGGERLSALLEALPDPGALPDPEALPNPGAPPDPATMPHMAGGAAPVFATEGWAPNLPVARARLAAHSVDVLRYDAEAGHALALPDRSLDLVMSRHESYEPAEVARVLAPGGRFLTQQVDGGDAPEIHAWFGGEALYAHVTAGASVDALEAAGMRVDQVDTWEGTMTFGDVAALVAYVGLVPWDSPDFTVASNAERLIELSAAGPLTVTQRRFRVYATRP